jgi:hypothetical protein
VDGVEPCGPGDSDDRAHREDGRDDDEEHDLTAATIQIAALPQVRHPHSLPLRRGDGNAC